LVLGGAAVTSTLGRSARMASCATVWSSDDEFNQFVTNEVIDPSSSDDENDLFFGAAHMIAREYL
jgi:hypothetical protein